MTTDEREHEAEDEILLVGRALRTVGEWRDVLPLPLPAADSCDLAHAHLHPVTLQLTGLYSWTVKLLHRQL